MLRNEVQQKMTVAMKARDRVRLEALRYLWSLIKNAEIDLKRELEDNEVIKVIGMEVKKRKEALRLASTSLSAGAQGKLGDKMKEWVQEEEAKMKVLQEFLPEQMGEEEISELVSEVIGELGSPPAGGFGRIMGEVMRRVAGKAEGKLVAQLVKRKLDQQDIAESERVLKETKSDEWVPVEDLRKK